MRDVFQAKLQSNVKQVDHYLVIKNVTIADSGYYMCTATNRGGTDIKIVHLHVNGKLIFIRLVNCCKISCYFSDI